MQHYVVGFQFARRGNLVTLIRKNHPEWQAGKLNGVGGKTRRRLSSHGARIGRRLFGATMERP